jgi:hypothetical protein
VYVWQMVFVFLLSVLSASLDGKGLSIQATIGPKHVEAWLFNKVRANSVSCWFNTQKQILLKTCPSTYFLRFFANVPSSISTNKISIGRFKICHISIRTLQECWHPC